MTDVLTPSECAAMIAAAESIGFTPDEPAAGTTASALSSVLAHNVFWLADPELLAHIASRTAPFLPSTSGGGALAGINARWRVYRYVPGALYRPHIDGAWPGSGVDADGKYVYDVFGDRWSRMTFLVYLNEDFSGGETTFFVPSEREGVMDAWGVKPRTGCVACFPHGDTVGSLLHEGSGVTNGAKYVIRTDVLYMLPKGASAPASQ
ncbi:oxidoreductase-like protein [Blyttiomyces helicus]|uniref:Oxidoreductase-like protein n=1 Tax=Blyttiomyces helicus TaxID=388810 RepID=A0A4P9WBX2_9FUNG|nr:oxidoreductase-like protein [Blyttiomyces helicus]|eukprot:RKO89073.1 oxidoreductase-like protein [Blyttiomyces helicus]